MTVETELVCGDLREVLAAWPESFLEACVTDPPYNLGFMGKEWDGDIACNAGTWRHVLRVLKPGAHLVAFGGTRTWHRIAVAIEDAGFEIRDNLAWLYGQGFPKSLNMPGGIGTALKPCFEPIILARKPLIGTVAANVAEHGTGGINIDACRLPGVKQTPGSMPKNISASEMNFGLGARERGPGQDPNVGRWPPNVCIDEEVAADLDAANGCKTSGKMAAGTARKTRAGYAGPMPSRTAHGTIGDTGGVSRYFYCPKANGKERDAGLDAWPVLSGGDMTDRTDGAPGATNPRSGAGRGGDRRNPHPTVKPIALMRWLCRLVTPVDGWVLDPFMGSGSTGCAAVAEGFHFAGIDLSPEYVRLARDRIAHRNP